MREAVFRYTFRADLAGLTQIRRTRSTQLESLDTLKDNMRVRLPGIFALLTFYTLVLTACGGRLVAAREYSTEEPAGIRYLVRTDAALERMWVKVCFDGPPPDRLEPMTSVANDVLVEAYGPEGHPLEVDPNIKLGQLGFGDCVRYEVDLERASWTSRFAQRDRGELLISQSLWLWRPASVDLEEIPVSVEFSLPRGLFVSTPWPRRGDFHFLNASAFNVVGNTVFLRRPPVTEHIGGVLLEIAQLDGDLEVSRSGIRHWLKEALRSARSMFGHFPTSRLQVVVVPIGPGWRPVAFGLVRRGGGASVMLLVHENAQLDELVSDWTAVHEFSHLAMPRMHQEDRWISEGFATYYQEVLRARAGLQTPLEAWQRIDEGFERGRRSGAQRTLWRESAEGRSFRRIYWAGAAFFLEADVRLRQSGSSLDELVGASQEAWAGQPLWHGRACVRRFDTLMGIPVVEPVLDRYGAMREFPSMEWLYQQLGLQRGRDGKLQMTEAPLVSIRDAIMRPEPR